MAAGQLSMFDQEAVAPAQPKPSYLNLSRTVPGDPQRVCDQWLIPVFVGEWLFGSALEPDQILRLENTVRKGGEFSYCASVGGTVKEYSGEYLELDIPRKLVFTWSSKSFPGTQCRVSVQFEDAGARTRLKMKIGLPAELQQQRDRIRKEWAARCVALATRLKR